MELIVGSHRKNLLLGFALLGSLACMLFAAVGRGGALWAGLLAIVGNVISREGESYFRFLSERVSFV